MIDVVVGGVIIVTATSSLLMALDLAQKAFDESGRYPLTTEEKDILVRAGIDRDDTEDFYVKNILSLPRDAQ